jgi:hypothetical protein
MSVMPDMRKKADVELTLEIATGSESLRFCVT